MFDTNALPYTPLPIDPPIMVEEDMVKDTMAMLYVHQATLMDDTGITRTPQHTSVFDIHWF